MKQLDKQEVGDGIVEGLINTVIAVAITYGIHRFLTESGDLKFALVAVAATAFFTGYFTSITGGVSFFDT